MLCALATTQALPLPRAQLKPVSREVDQALRRWANKTPALAAIKGAASGGGGGSAGEGGKAKAGSKEGKGAKAPGKKK